MDSAYRNKFLADLTAGILCACRATMLSDADCYSRDEFFKTVSELEAVRKGEVVVTGMAFDDENGVAMADAVVFDQSGRNRYLPLIYPGHLDLADKDSEAVEGEHLLKADVRGQETVEEGE